MSIKEDREKIRKRIIEKEKSSESFPAT